MNDPLYYKEMSIMQIYCILVYHAVVLRIWIWIGCCMNFDMNEIEDDPPNQNMNDPRSAPTNSLSMTTIYYVQAVDTFVLWIMHLFSLSAHW